MRGDRLPSANRINSWFRALTSYDIFPDFSAKVRRWFYNPFGVLIFSALAALLCGLFLHAQGFVLLGGVSAVIVLGLAWPWLSLRGLDGSISFDRSRACEGEQVEICLTLRNRLLWSVWGLAVRGGFIKHPQEGAIAAVVASIASTPRRRTVRCKWNFVPTCRGVYPLAAARLVTGFPFGLWENKKLLLVEISLIVWPKTFPVGPVPPLSGAEQVEGNVSRNKVGSNGDVLGVRPYRRGDSPRRIHWMQSARHDRLIVCELQSNARPVFQLVLDADARVHAGQGPEGSREWAIRIVASLARGWLEAGAQVGVVWHGQAIPASSGQQQLTCILDGLARLADSAGPDLATTLAGPACRGFREGLQVIVTTDAGLASMSRSCFEDDQQRWVVLRTASFCGTPAAPPAPAIDMPVRPWLWIDAADEIPALLRGGWKEARHGS
jgi:uncharacterized protein (DUF58 family)